jgi:hypothetical protein
MLVVAAARNAGAPVERDHQRGAGDKLVHELLQDGVAGIARQHQVKIARGLDLGAARAGAAFVHEAALLLELHAEGGDVFRRQSFGGGQHDARLDQATGIEDLPRLFRRRDWRRRRRDCARSSPALHKRASAGPCGQPCAIHRTARRLRFRQACCQALGGDQRSRRAARHGSIVPGPPGSDQRTLPFRRHSCFASRLSPNVTRIAARRKS